MKEFGASLILIAVGLALVGGEAAGVEALSGYVLKGTNISYGWFALALGVGTGIFNWFTRDSGKKKKKKKKDKEGESDS